MSLPTMRYEQGHKERTRERILDEAAAIIRSDGPERLSVATLMRRVGLTHGGFYVHFASKDDLVSEAVAYMFEVRRKVTEPLDETDPRRALEQIVDSYLSPVRLVPSESSCPIPMLAGEHHRLPEAARRRVTLGLERLTGTIDRLLDLAGVEVAPFTADSVVSEMIGAVALARVHRTERRAHDLLQSANRSVRSKLRLASLS